MVGRPRPRMPVASPKVESSCSCPRWTCTTERQLADGRSASTSKSPRGRVPVVGIRSRGRETWTGGLTSGGGSRCTG
jgi:hypothetical protein